MALIINQGIQKESNFDVIEEMGVLAKIIEVKEHKTKSDTFVVTFRLLNGKNANRLVWDNIEYNPNSNWVWKYQSLRRAAGCPYSKDEGTNIDIEKLLIDKAVILDLTSSIDKQDSTKKWQRINYKKPEAGAYKQYPEGEINGDPDGDLDDLSFFDEEDFYEEDSDPSTNDDSDMTFDEDGIDWGV